MSDSLVWPPKLFYHWHPVAKILLPSSKGWHFRLWSGEEILVPNLGDGKGYRACVGERPDNKISCGRCGWQAKYLRQNESGEWSETCPKEETDQDN